MGEEDLEYEGDYDEAFDDMEFAEDDEEFLEAEGEEEDQEDEPAPGQILNLSWCHGTDPSLVSFPF